MQYSLQGRFAISYLVMIILCLIFVNVYPVVSYRDMLFETKYMFVKNQARLIASSMSGLSVLEPEEVSEVMSLLVKVSLNRVIVTDENASIVYDSTDNEGNRGKSVMFSELLMALSGKDVFYSRITEEDISSRACIPVTNGTRITGAVYIYENDSASVGLLKALNSTMRRLSYAVCSVAVIMALIMLRVMGGKMNKISKALETLGGGDYDYRIEVGRERETSQLAEEFNALAERLQMTEQMRRRFVSDASHELKTPLAGIILLSDSIVQNENMDIETIREFVYDIGREAERLSRMTQRLLQLTRLDANASEKPVVLNCKLVVEEALKMLKPLAIERNITLESSLTDGCHVLAGADDIHQVVFNLVENAIKYNVDGGSVKVQLYSTVGRVVLIIDDTGVGIPEESLGLIFDRFYRVDVSRSRKVSGSGIGLSIVSDMVKKYGGEVSAQRRAAGGMRFVVTFIKCNDIPATDDGDEEK